MINKKNLKSFIIIGLLIILVFVIILIKNKTRMGREPEPNVTFNVQDTTVGDSIELNSQDSVLSKGVLAIVDGSEITEEYLNKRYEVSPDQHKQMYKNNKKEFLELLVTRELLYQDAVRGGGSRKLDDIEDIEEKKDKAVGELLMDVSSVVKISEEEMKAFYNEHISEMQGAPFEQVRINIKNYLTEQKRAEIIDDYIEKLKSEADIIRNSEWIAEQRALQPQNPLDAALKSGKPTVLDMGEGTCIPCKMMKPIFEELKEEYRGKANIILLEISEYRNLARKYQVMVIPTQIFFDRDGNQYWRHKGFLAKEKIEEKLNELGVD